MSTSIANAPVESGLWCGPGGKVWLPFDAILAQCQIDHGDALLIAGSLVEGLGDDESDVNVYIIKDDTFDPSHFPLSEGRRSTVHYEGFPHDGKLVQLSTSSWCEAIGRTISVEYWHRSVLNEAFCRLAETVQQGQFFKFDLFLTQPPFRVARIYHALCVGFPLIGADQLACLKSHISISDYCFMRFNEIAGNYADYVDILGAYRSGDYLRSLDLASQFLTAQMMAFTYLHLNTNFRRKWLLQYVQRLPSVYRSIASEFIDCVYGRQGSLASFKSRTIDCMRLVDKLFAEFGVVLREHSHILLAPERVKLSNGNEQDVSNMFRRSVIGGASPFCEQSFILV